MNCWEGAGRKDFRSIQYHSVIVTIVSFNFISIFSLCKHMRLTDVKLKLLLTYYDKVFYFNHYCTCLFYQMNRRVYRLKKQRNLLILTV